MGYGYREHQKRCGNGENKYRGATFAQPGALEVGDVLVTGERIAKPTGCGYNSIAIIYVDDGPIAGIRGLEVPSRLPIAIRRKRKVTKR